MVQLLFNSAVSNHSLICVADMVARTSRELLADQNRHSVSAAGPIVALTSADLKKI